MLGLPVPSSTDVEPGPPVAVTPYATNVSRLRKPYPVMIVVWKPSVCRCVESRTVIVESAFQVIRKSAGYHTAAPAAPNPRNTALTALAAAPPDSAWPYARGV